MFDFTLREKLLLVAALIVAAALGRVVSNGLSHIFSRAEDVRIEFLVPHGERAQGLMMPRKFDIASGALLPSKAHDRGAAFSVTNRTSSRLFIPGALAIGHMKRRSLATVAADQFHAAERTDPGFR